MIFRSIRSAGFSLTCVARIATSSLVLGLLAPGTAAAAGSQDVIHQGPSLDIFVERGPTRLPLSLVNRLQAGDRVLVRPIQETIATGDWVLLLGRVSARGNQVYSQRFDVATLHTPAVLEIQDDGQVPVIMLAPQLRNLFGLNTSLYESYRLLDEVLRADPQRFHDLQRADQINLAIQAISRGINRRVGKQGHEAAMQAAREVAARFGVRQIEAECFKNQTVNTECVATSIVANRDFVLPGAKDLSEMIGPRKGADLNTFLTADLRVLSQATEYLGSKYRDTYDFAPTFGRRQPQNARVDLFSITRFRSGSIKTAYIYVPSWFAAPMPLLTPDSSGIACYAAGQLALNVKGSLPLGNYWHDWLMAIFDPEGGPALADVEGLRFDPDAGSFRFDASFAELPRPLRGNLVSARLSGRFAFDPVDIAPFEMAVPLRSANAMLAEVSGIPTLVAGEKTQLIIRSPKAAACVTGLSMRTEQGIEMHHRAGTPAKLDVDLSNVPPGLAQLTLSQHGAEPITVPVRVLNRSARVQRIEHTDLEDSIIVRGEGLERIVRIELGQVSCTPDEQPETASNLSLRGQQAQKYGVPAAVAGESLRNALRFSCQGGIRENATLPDQAIVHHRNNEPPPIKSQLKKFPARPSVRVMSDSPSGLLITPSAKALQWQLSPQDPYLSEDSGLSLLLQAVAPYRLARGGYQLQLRFIDDPRADSPALAAPLIADFSHDELRTRTPIGFNKQSLPSVINALEYRVVHQASGQAGDWQGLQRSVLLLPDLDKAACSPQGDALWISGRNLDLIDAVRIDDPAGPQAQAEFAPPRFDPCPGGLCLRLPPQAEWLGKISVRLRWVDGRLFTVLIPKPDKPCTLSPTRAAPPG